MMKKLILALLAIAIQFFAFNALAVDNYEQNANNLSVENGTNGFIENDIFDDSPATKKVDSQTTPTKVVPTPTPTPPQDTYTPTISTTPVAHVSVAKLPNVTIPVSTGVHKTFYRVVFTSIYAMKYHITKGDSFVGVQFYRKGYLHFKDRFLRRHGVSFHPVNNSEGLYTKISYIGKMSVKDYTLSKHRLVIDLTRINPNDTSYDDYVKNQKTDASNVGETIKNISTTPDTPKQNSDLSMTLKNSDTPDVTKTINSQTEKNLLNSNSTKHVDNTYDFAAPKVKSDAVHLVNPTLTFAWDISVASASFTRGDNLWIVFDHKLNNLNVNQIKTATQGFVNTIKEVDTNNGSASAIILNTKEPLTAVPRNEGLSWLYTLKRGRILPKTDIPVDKKLDNARRVLFLPVTSPSFPIQFTDPDNKDNIVVIPIAQPGRGIKTSLSLPQVDILSSNQGIPLLVKDDNLIIQSLESGVEIKHKYNLFFTSKSKPTQYELNTRGDLLKLASLATTPDKMREARIAIENEIISQKGLHRNIARMKLARFYMAQGWFREAESILDLIKEQDPETVERLDFRLASGIISLMRGDLPQAWEKLYAPQLSSYDEALLWRGVYLHRAGDDVSAKPLLENYYAIIQNYPKALHYLLGKEVIESSINVEDYKIAGGLIDDLKALNLSNYDEDELLFLQARILEKTSFDVDDPLEIYNTLIATADNERIKVHAKYNRATLLFDKDQMPVKDYLDVLDKLAYKWKGGIFEYKIKQNMAKLYLKNKMYRKSLLTLKDMIDTFGNKYNVKAIPKIMKSEFDDLFLNGKADEMDPVKALSLYNEFKELTPAGTRGEEMIRKLVDRLVSVDLFDDASKLLSYQVKHRLEGNFKNRVAVRNALVYLMKPNPSDALDALKDVDYKSITPAVSRQVTQLKAQALSELDKTAEALKLIENDDSLDGLRLRADLYWKQHNWPLASKAYSTLLPRLKIKPHSKLSDNQASFLNNLATVLVLAGNTGGLEVLRINYGNSMANTKFKKTFALLTSSDSSPTNINDLNSELNNSDSYHNFMDSYSERIAKHKLSGIN